MRTDKQMEKQASHIADAIVDLVERANGPVTLSEINRKIPGFAAKEPPAWEYFYEHDDGTEVVIWDGMTEAGFEALRKVIRGRRVAIQFVKPVLYFLMENCLFHNDQWWPIVLLPARAANVETPAYLERTSQKQQDYFIKRATAEGLTGYRRLTPGSAGNADCFSLL